MCKDDNVPRVPRLPQFEMHDRKLGICSLGDRDANVLNVLSEAKEFASLARKDVKRISEVARAGRPGRKLPSLQHVGPMGIFPQAPDSTSSYRSAPSRLENVGEKIASPSTSCEESHKRRGFRPLRIKSSCTDGGSHPSGAVSSPSKGDKYGFALPSTPKPQSPAQRGASKRQNRRIRVGASKVSEEAPPPVRRARRATICAATTDVRVESKPQRLAESGGIDLAQLRAAIHSPIVCDPVFLDGESDANSTIATLESRESLICTGNGLSRSSSAENVTPSAPETDAAHCSSRGRHAFRRAMAIEIADSVEREPPLTDVVRSKPQWPDEEISCTAGREDPVCPVPVEEILCTAGPEDPACPVPVEEISCTAEPEVPACQAPVEEILCAAGPEVPICPVPVEEISCTTGPQVPVCPAPVEEISCTAGPQVSVCPAPVEEISCAAGPQVPVCPAPVGEVSCTVVSGPPLCLSPVREVVEPELPLCSTLAKEISCTAGPKVRICPTPVDDTLSPVARRWCRETRGPIKNGLTSFGSPGFGTHDSINVDSLIVHPDFDMDDEQQPEPAPSGICDMTMACAVSLESPDIGKVYAGENRTWVRGKMLGLGSLGMVFAAMDSDTGLAFAVKQITEQDGDAAFMRALENEIDILTELKHTNIVGYQGHDTIDGKLYIYLEFMAGGSIASILSSFGPIDEVTMAAYTADVLAGLHYLHTQPSPCLHRDIKGANILLGADGKAKLSDFGCSKRSEDNMTETITGSIPWMAPEVLKGGGYGQKADIWSLGCLVVEMSSGCHPWESFDNNIVAMVRIAMSSDIPNIPDNLSDKCRSFISDCLIRDPAERPSAAKLLEHPFVVQVESAANPASLPQ